MHLLDGQPVFSATDLVGFLACDHLTELERAALAGEVARPHRDNPELEVIRARDVGRPEVAAEEGSAEERGRRVR